MTTPAGPRIVVVNVDTTASMTDAIGRQARAVASPGTEICLGGAGMTGLTELVADKVGVPVVDGVAAAVRLAESQHALGLRTSKVRTYAETPAIAVTGWPLSAQTPATAASTVL